MTSPVITEIERQKRSEQIRQWDAAEKSIISQLPPFSQRLLTEHESAALVPFLRWCQQHGVRSLPVKPCVLAAYIAEQQYKTEPTETLLAIERQHSIHNLASPVATAVVRAALAPLIDAEPPRAWSLQEKAKFFDAPVEVREIIARRSKQRETVFSRLQNENAEIRRELSAQIIKAKAGPASNGAEPNKRTERIGGEDRASPG